MTRPPLPVLPFFMDPDIQVEVEAAMHAYTDACVDAAIGSMAEAQAQLMAENRSLRDEVAAERARWTEAVMAEIDQLRKDAARWRHCKAHGHPMTGPQCIAWTFDGRMVFGATLEEAVDSAMAYSVP